MVSSASAALLPFLAARRRRIQRRTWTEGIGERNDDASAGVLTTQEELAHLREVFPQVTEGELRRVLLASPSLEGAIEQLLM